MKYSIVQVNAKSGTIGEVGDILEVDVGDDYYFQDPVFSDFNPGDSVTIKNSQKSYIRGDIYFKTKPITEICEVEEDRILFRCSDNALYMLYRLH